MAKAAAASAAPQAIPIARKGRLREEYQTRSAKRSHEGTVRHSKMANSNCATRIHTRWKTRSTTPISAIWSALRRQAKATALASMGRPISRRRLIS